MTIQNKTKLKRYASYTIILLLAHLFQNSIRIFPEILNVRPILIISLSLCIAMFEGEFIGAIFGLFAGALWDTVTAAADGYNAAFLMVLCAVCGVVLRIFLRNNLVSFAIINSVSTVFYFLTYVLFFYTANGVGGAWTLLIRYYLPMTLYTLMLTPFVYAVIRAVDKKYPQNYMEY